MPHPPEAQLLARASLALQALIDAAGGAGLLARASLALQALIDAAGGAQLLARASLALQALIDAAGGPGCWRGPRPCGAIVRSPRPNC